MNGVKLHGDCRARFGSTSIAPLIVVAAVLAGGAIAVVVAVRAAGPASDKPSARGVATSEPVAANPLRAGDVKPKSAPSDANQQPAIPSDKSVPDKSARNSPPGDGKNLPPAATPGEHPLDPAIALAHKVLDNLQKHVKDYTCVIVKQERLDGKLGEPEFMAAKIRQEPFSVYLKFLKPDDERGREVIYVAGANDGKMLIREGSGLKRSLGILSLPPTGFLAMQGNRYPISDLGLMHLTQRLLEIAGQDRRYGEVEVHFFKDAKVNDRVCTLIEVVHPVERRSFLFHKAQVYIDDELNVPIRYAAYMWPKKPGEEPPLDECYTYLKLKLNVGLTDADFDSKNPSYHFTDK